MAAVLDVIAILRGGNDTPVALFGEGLGAATAIAAVMSESSLGVASLLLLHAHLVEGVPALGELLDQRYIAVHLPPAPR